MSPVPQKRPQLTGDELQQLKWLLGGVLTLLAVSTIAYMDVDAWALTGVTSIATLAMLVRPTLPGRVPPLAHTLAFPAIVAFFAADLWLKAEVLPAMVRLDILLLLYRNISYRQRRDDLQIIVLGLFLIVVAGVLTVSLTFAVHLLVYTACALALLLVVTLSDATGQTSGAKAPASNGPVVPVWAQRTDWRQLFRRLRRVMDWRVFGLGAVLFAGVVAVSALLFLAIPRFQFENSMFLDRFVSKKARAGFSDTIRIGDVSEIVQDNGLAMSIDPPDPSLIPAAPYWRMLVLDSYSNGTFRLSPELRATAFQDTVSSSSLEMRVRSVRRRDPQHWTFFVESGVSRYLPLLGRFATLRFRDVQKFRMSPELAIVTLNEEPVTMTAYRVEDFDLAPTLADPIFASEWRRRAGGGRLRPALYSNLPVFAQDTDAAKLKRSLAEAVGTEKLSAPEFAQRVSVWLKQGHGYSLAPTIPNGTGDPLVRWLSARETKGHCELFAGAFVLLARAGGYPARVVTGFRGGSWNVYSNSFTVRNADAHAWAEIFDEQAGAWLRADPLAVAASGPADETRSETATAERRDRSWKARLESLRVFWYRRIVSFDQRSQAETLKLVKEATQNSGKRLRETIAAAAAAVREWFTRPWGTTRIGASAGALAGTIGLVWLWRRYGRDWWRRAIRGRGKPGHDPVRREAARWLRKLEDSGALEDDASKVKIELQRLRFGARPTWPEPEKVFRRARRTLRDVRRRGRVR